MTLSELLEELKGIDPETYEALRNYPIYCSDDEALTVNLLESRNNILVMDALRGRIQRACERRGWPLVLSFDCDPDHPQTWVAEICDSRGALLGIAGGCNSSTVALLTAYVAAVLRKCGGGNESI